MAGPRFTVTRRTRRWLPAIAYMCLIFYVSSLSDPLPPVTARVWDKLLHGAGYAVLGGLFGLALRGEGFGLPTAMLTGLLMTSAYGASDEFHQSFVPGRNADVTDWIVDTIGGAAGAGACLLPERRRVRARRGQ